MNRTQAIQKYITLGVYIATTINPVRAAELGPDLWQQLSTQAPQEMVQLERILDEQKQLELGEETLREQLEHGRQLRAMQREAVLLSELNLAWIYDELENWDCRIAEAKTREVALRLAELREFEQRLNTICSAVDGNAGYQQQACQSQGEELTASMANLEKLTSRYAASCPLTTPIIRGDQ